MLCVCLVDGAAGRAGTAGDEDRGGQHPHDHRRHAEEADGGTGSQD